jgi:hypothetical protein
MICALDSLAPVHLVKSHSSFPVRPTRRTSSSSARSPREKTFLYRHAKSLAKGSWRVKRTRVTNSVTMAIAPDVQRRRPFGVIAGWMSGR